LKFRLSVQAKADIQDIRVYHAQFGASVVANVNDDIFDSFQLILDFPDTGTRTDEHGLKRSVSTKYKYVILHRKVGNTVEVRAIFRSQNR